MDRAKTKNIDNDRIYKNSNHIKGLEATIESQANNYAKRGTEIN